MLLFTDYVSLFHIQCSTQLIMSVLRFYVMKEKSNLNADNSSIQNCGLARRVCEEAKKYMYYLGSYGSEN